MGIQELNISFLTDLLERQWASHMLTYVCGGHNQELVKELITKLNESFALKMKSSLSYFLGIEVKMDCARMRLFQSKSVQELLEKQT